MRILGQKSSGAKDTSIGGVRDMLACLWALVTFNETEVDQVHSGGLFARSNHYVVGFQIPVQVTFTV